jgi:hypothetical protein
LKRIIFLVEEPSMKALLEDLLPRLVPGLVPDQTFLCVAHEGKSDLERSLPRKLRAWRESGVRFVVVRDNDGADCVQVKKALRESCRRAGREDTLVRLACQELEAWYVGEPEALAEAFGRDDLARLARQARFREPDAVPRPAELLAQLVPEFQKISGARRLARRLTLERNRSPSFRVFVDGVARVAQALGLTGGARG